MTTNPAVCASEPAAVARRELSKSEQAVVAVQRRDAIGFGHRWIVERRIDEVHLSLIHI